MKFALKKQQMKALPDPSHVTAMPSATTAMPDW
jgi:hypothetical protein